MRALRRQALMRLRTALSEPLDVPDVVLTGAATLLFWPGLTPESGGPDCVYLSMAVHPRPGGGRR